MMNEHDLEHYKLDKGGKFRLVDDAVNKDEIENWQEYRQRPPPLRMMRDEPERIEETIRQLELQRRAVKSVNFARWLTDALLSIALILIFASFGYLAMSFLANWKG